MTAGARMANKKRKTEMNKQNLRFAKEDIEAIECLAEQLSDELNASDLGIEGDDDGVAPIKENDVAKIAEELVRDADDDIVPDDKKVIADDDAQSICAEADELENQIACHEVTAEADALEKELDACTTTAGESCPECGKKPCECNKESSEKVASELKPGDEANGGDPSVSEIVDNDIDAESIRDVVGIEDKEYVAKITARLDRVANALEKRGMKRMAFRVDQLSDRLEASVKK